MSVIETTYHAAQYVDVLICAVILSCAYLPCVQALDEAISRRLDRVEAGAQGEHKISRGYLPHLTYSSHYITDPGFRTVVKVGGLASDPDGLLRIIVG